MRVFSVLTLVTVFFTVLTGGVCAAATITQISAGDSHTVALDSDGYAWTWGLNASGQLGTDGNVALSSTPTRVALSGLVSVAAGAAHTVVAKADGTVYAWGANYSGQLGDWNGVPRPSPVRVNGIANVARVAAGPYYTVAIKTDATVWAWGQKLGVSIPTASYSPEQVSGLTDVRTVAAGGGHVLALKNDGTVWAWGSNSSGELGDGTTQNRTTPVQIPGLSGIEWVAAVGAQSYAGKADGTVLAWGEDFFGILGGAISSVPIEIPELANVTAIAGNMDDFHRCHIVFRKSDGTAWAWGINDYGMLGNGSTLWTDGPVQMEGLAGVTAVAAGQCHSVVLKNDGTVWACGDDGRGELGDGFQGKLLAPTRVPDLNGVAAVSAGGNESVALKRDGTVWWWGHPFLFDSASTPTQVSGLSGVKAISRSFTHTLALKNDGTVWAWGVNYNGNLGDGTTDHSLAPVKAIGLNQVVAIAAGDSLSVAVKEGGTVWTWGANWDGQLGDGTTTDSAVPIQVPGLYGIVAVAAGDRHVLALKCDGTVWAWGNNDFGQLGDGSTTSSSVPLQVPGLSGVVSVAAGAEHSVALKSDGNAFAWGNNRYGQLCGVYIADSIPTPWPAFYVHDATAIAAGGNDTILVRSGLQAYLAGQNTYGQIGDGTTIDKSLSTLAQGPAGVTSAAAGDAHTIVSTLDGCVWTWGDDSGGQLGDGHSYQSAYPVRVDVPARPTGTVKIGNVSGEYADLTLSLSYPYEGFRQMCLSNDGVFDTETWESFTTTKTWHLAGGQGYQTVYAKFRTSSGPESDVVCASICLDLPLPSIDYLTCSPGLVAKGDKVHVAVRVYGPGASSVMAGNTALTLSDYTWSGDLVATADSGLQSVLVVAEDQYGLKAQKAVSYTVGPVYGARCGSLAGSLMGVVCGKNLYKLCGKVTTIDPESFWLNDGSATVKVMASGYGGLSSGDYVTVRGIINPLATPPTVTCPADKVTKNN